MPDLSDLDDFNQGLPPMNPLPPSEVRRRGNRLRRRNTALAAGAGVLVAALAIGTPVIALSGDGGSDIDPAPSPTVRTTVTTIPTGFPVGDGMGTAGDPAHVGEERGEVVFTEIGICGRSAWSLEAQSRPAVDALGAVWSDGIEGGEQRTLATYADDATASDALDEMSTSVDACPPPKPVNGQAIVPIALESAVGEESFAFLEQYQDSAGPTGEGNVFVIARVGNALLIDKTYIGGAGDRSIAQDTVSLLTDRSAGVVEAMCLFSVEGC